MSHPSPSPAFEQDAMSVSSELRPRLSSLKEEAPEEELNSLSSLAEEAISFLIPTDNSNIDHIGQECPTNCPCACHLPSPLPAVNEYRPSVIMVPVAREHGEPSVTHFPIAMQVTNKKWTTVGSYYNMARSKGIRIPESGKFLLLGFGTREIFAGEIRNPGL